MQFKAHTMQRCAAKKSPMKLTFSVGIAEHDTL